MREWAREVEDDDPGQRKEKKKSERKSLIWGGHF